MKKVWPKKDEGASTEKNLARKKEEELFSGS